MSMSVEVEAAGHLEQAYVEYQETENFEQALAECDTAIDLDPYLADAHNLRGVVLEELGRPEQALVAYQNALRLDPDFLEARENLAHLQTELAARHRLVTIATFSFPTEAYILRSRLETEGIWSFVADADTVTANWLYSNAIGGVKLKVTEADAERALELLNQKAEPTDWVDEDSETEDQELTCPQCGSHSIHYEKYATRLVFLFWLIFNFTFPFPKRKWKCLDCGHTWKID